jgi:hypothetical protein
VSWDEQFAARYDEWSAEMTDDMSFYVSLAVGTEGRSSSWPSATAAWRFP